MPLVDHLRELRGRLLASVLAVVPGASVGWVFYDSIIRFLLEPVCQTGRTVHGRCGSLTVVGLLAPFNLKLTIAAVTGLLIAAPVWLYQIWAFVTPGLHRKERRWTLLFLAASVPLFFAGVALGYVTFPRAVQVLQGFTPAEAGNLLPVNEYLSIFIRLLIVFGISFELPIFVVLLNFAGVLSAGRILASWRWIVLGSCVFGAVATPTGDPFTMLAVAIPMLALLALAYLVAAIHDRRRGRGGDSVRYDTLDDEEPSPLDERPSRLDDT